MTSPEEFQDTDSLIAPMDLGDRDREILLIAEIQRLLTELPSQLPDYSVARHQHRSYEFTPDALITAKLPGIIQDMVAMGYEPVAYAQFNIDKTENFNSISVSFDMIKDPNSSETKSDEVTMTHIGLTIEPDHGDIIGKVTSYVNGSLLSEQDTKATISREEIYAFLASIAGSDNEELAMLFMDHPDQFSRYLHNPFAFSHVDDLFNRRASNNYRQDQFSIDDPTTLKMEMTVTHTEDELTHVEADFWTSPDAYTHPINISIVLEKAEYSAIPVTEEKISFDFGAGEEKEYILPDSQILFRIGENEYQPPISDLEEIQSRLQNIMQHFGTSFVEIPYTEDDSDETDTDDLI